MIALLPFGVPYLREWLIYGCEALCTRSRKERVCVSIATSSARVVSIAKKEWESKSLIEKKKEKEKKKQVTYLVEKRKLDENLVGVVLIVQIL